MLTEYDHKSQLADWIVHTPLLLLNQPLKFGGGFDVLGDFGWPLFLLALPIFIFQKQVPHLRWLIGYSIVSILIWYCSKPVLRFLMPVLPVLALFAGLAFSMLIDANALWKFFAIFLTLPWLMSNLFLYALFANDLKLFDVAIGLTPRIEFLDRRLTYMPVYDYIDQNLPENSGVFLLGEQRSYRLNRTFVACNLFAATPLAAVCNSATSDSGLIRYFQLQKMTHILTNEGEIARLGGLDVFGFNKNGAEILRQFLSRHTSVILENQAVKLLQINY
jgi:hypothetical protein